MHMWSEDVASRGAQEVASFLIQYMEKNLTSETKNVILYSDRCGGQNLNIKITLMLMKYLSTHITLKTITQKYFVSGHSFNSCDRSFSTIEVAKKEAIDLYTPDNWIDLVKTAKVKEPKFVVTKMERADFFTSSGLEKLIFNRKVIT